MINPNTRVNQLDATLLDNELFQSLNSQLSSILVKVSPFYKTKYSNELNLVLNSLLYKLTIWDKSQSYGLFLQNLKYKEFTRLKKVVYYVVFIFGGYLVKKYQSFIYEDNIDDDENNPSIKTRLTKLVKSAFIKSQSVYKLLSFLNFIDFLITGKYQSLKLRLLGIKIHLFNIELAKLNKGNVSFEFQNRQLIWNTFLEFILFILPILSNSKVQSIFNKLLLNKSSSSTNQVLLNHLPQNKCSICHENKVDDIKLTNPYITNCGHVFCYICLLTKLENSKNLNQVWNCNRCGSKVEYGKPFNDVNEGAIMFKLIDDDSDDDTGSESEPEVIEEKEKELAEDDDGLVEAVEESDDDDFINHEEEEDYELSDYEEEGEEEDDDDDDDLEL